MTACLRLPNFAVTVTCQQQPALTGQPVILARYTGRSGKVYAASVEAQTLGIHTGMTLSRARALCPEAVMLPAAEGSYARLLHDLLERLRLFTHKLEPSPSPYPNDALLWLDLGRLPEHEIAPLGQRILAAVSDFPAALGIASGKTLSQIAALHTPVGEMTVVLHGTEPAYIAPLALSTLPLPSELARRLAQLGLHTFGHLAALPRSAVQMQFGSDGLRLHQIALGHDPQPVIPYGFEQPICAAQGLDGAVADRTTLEGILCDLAGRLAECLRTANQTSQQVLLRLDLDDGGCVERDLTPRQPVAQTPALYRLLVRLLDQCSVASGIVRIVTELRRLAEVLPRQLALFAEMISGAQRVQQIAERLSLRHHLENFYVVTLADENTYLPEHTFRLERLEVA